MPTRLVTAVLIALLGCSCARGPWKRSLVSTEAGVAIFREKKFDENDAPIPLGLAHPAPVTEDQFRLALGNLSYQRDNFLVSDDNGPLFRREDLDRIVPRLAAEFSQLGPDERLRLLYTRMAGRFLMARSDSTSAVVFATSPDEVHLAFDIVHRDVTPQDGAIESVRFENDPTTLESVDFEIILPRDTSGAFDMVRPTPSNWVIFRPAVLWEAAGGAQLTGRSAPDLPRAKDDSPRPTELGNPRPASSDSEASTPEVPGNASDGNTQAPSVGETPTVTAPPEPAPRVEPDRIPAPPPGPAPRVIFPYKGFTVVELDGTYHAIAASEGAFDAARLRRGDYKTAIERPSVEALIESIDAILDSVEKRRPTDG